MKNTIQLTKLRLDGGTQPRVRIDMDVVRDYAERIKAGDDFPPVDVFHDGAEHWLAEGFHRYHAYKEAGHKVVPCTLRKGTVRDAILFSCGANGHHGLRRSPADKRKAVLTILNDAEWVKEFSDRKVAEICCVSHPFVAGIRTELETLPVDGKRTGRDGKRRPARTKPPEESAEASEAYTCPNCQGHERDDDGDCAKCHEPASVPEPEAEPSGGYEPIEAKKHLDKLADLIAKAAREHAEAVKILGPSEAMGTVFSGLDTASIALTKFRNAFKRKVK